LQTDDVTVILCTEKCGRERVLGVLEEYDGWKFPTVWWCSASEWSNLGTDLGIGMWVPRRLPPGYNPAPGENLTRRVYFTDFSVIF